MAEKIVLSYREYVWLQVKLALEPENKWYAGEKIGHDPTDDEAIMHFIKEGGSKDFADHYTPADLSSPEKQST